MNPEPKPSNPIELAISASHPNLLRGLELWLDLGLLSDGQVRRIGHRYLTCPLPTVAIPATQPTPTPDFVVETVARRSRPTHREEGDGARSPALHPAVPASFLSERLQALMAEISVIWLLVLGVFMVVVSSGVLAASQWQNFSPTGQYLVLLSYTLAFWFASIGASQRPNLQLTTTMLQATTLLIVPINFWMMDAVLLAQGGLGWAIALVAALGLTWISLRVLGSQVPAALSPRLLINTVALSWLHWGWGIPGIALLACYMGTVGTTTLLVYDTLRSPSAAEPTAPAEDVTATTQRSSMLPMLVITAATVVLILRATWVAGVPWSQLGLAVGLCGWLLCWLAARTRIQPVMNRLGAALLLVGWAISVPASMPLQAIAVSGLALERLSHQVRRSPHSSTLTLAVLVGLQAYGLLWRVVPPGGREVVLNGFQAIAGMTGMPVALVGLGLFPYVWLLLGLVRHWRKTQPPFLVLHLEQMALLLGAVLLLVGALNPWVRSLQFTLSALTLGLALRQRPTIPTVTIYLTHLLGLAAIVSWTDGVAPDLPPSRWALGFVGLAWLEWTGAAVPWPFSTRRECLPRWQESAWYLGLGLAGLSYLLWLLEWPMGDRPWLWLLIPLGLTLLALWSPFPYRRQAVGYSTLALICAPLLTLSDPLPRLAGLALATLLMLLNTRRWPNGGMAFLTLGFGLAALADGLWQGAGDRLPTSALAWIPAIVTLLLWLLWDRWISQPPSLRRDYAIAANLWAGLVSLATLLLLSLVHVGVYVTQMPLTQDWLLAIALVNLGLGYRLWRGAHELGRYGLAWGIELLVTGALLSKSVTGLEPWAIAHLALGAGALALGSGWRRQPQEYPPSLHLIPLGYATLGLLIGHADLVATTGLYTLALAGILMGVGRRAPTLKPLTYLAILAVSIGAYELLVYQLLQADGGATGDGMVLLSGLAMGIALGDRLLTRWVAPYLHLSPSEWEGIIALHWLGGGGWLMLALFYPMSLTGQWLWSGVAVGLALNALIAGRRLALWTDAGIVTTLLAIANALYLWVPDSRWLNTWAAAIACPVAIALYWLPWSRWGWPPRPWGRWARVLPGIVLAATAWTATIPVLLIVAAFYAWLARQQRQVRLSYISIVLTDWAVVRWLQDLQVNDSIWYTLLVGLSLIYVAQVDPGLGGNDERETRHWLRCLAIGLISLNAIYESEVSLIVAGITLVYSIGLVLLGLSLRIRAALFVGTLTFLVQVIRQLWLLVNLYPLLIWAVGLVIGLLFIWVAATFEARRHQVISFVRYWVAELEEWQ